MPSMAATSFRAEGSHHPWLGLAWLGVGLWYFAIRPNTVGEGGDQIARGGLEGRVINRRDPWVLSWVVLALLVASPAYAQDASILVVLLGPPIVLAAPVVGLIKFAWLRRHGHHARGLLAVLGLQALEVLLWVAFAAFTIIVYFAERWRIHAVVSVAAALAIGAAVNRKLLRSAGSAHASWQVAVLLSLATPAGLVVLAVLTYAVVVLSGK